MLIVSAFGNINSDTNDRVNSLHDYLSLDLKVITTDFSHRDKEYRTQASNRNVDYLHVTPYKKNLSITRIFSHWTFAIRLFIYLLKNGNNYKLIYCITPTPSSAFICSIYKRLTKRKYLIIDVIDIWPEGLLTINKHYNIFKVLFLPWTWMSIFAYKSASLLITATKGFKDRISKYNPGIPCDYFPLGIDTLANTKLLNQSTIKLHKPFGEIWICYAGNLGYSYDFNLMFESVERVQQKNKNIKFYVIGGGVRLEYIKDQFNTRGILGHITGNLSYCNYLKYLSYCDIGFNLYVNNSPVAQSYKFNDYVYSSLITINNLKGETADLISEYQIGINISNSSDELTIIINQLVENWESYSSWKNNCVLLINQVLSKDKVYMRLMDFLKTNLKL